jgi:hypothetical protein
MRVKLTEPIGTFSEQVILGRRAHWLLATRVRITTVLAVETYLTTTG